MTAQPGGARRRMVVVAAVAAAVAIPVAAADADAGSRSTALPGTARAHDVIRLDFDDLTQPDGTPVTEIRVTGTAQVTSGVSEINGGEILADTSRPGEGRAVRLPAFDTSANAPRAVVRVTPDEGRDRLSPRRHDFSFGADFTLDELSSQPGSTDDGDNLVQRGLYDDPAQFKLQLDGRRPSCRLLGTVAGAPVDVEVVSPVRVDSNHWYRAACVRSGRSLQVVVTQFDADGTGTRTTKQARSDAIIDIHMQPSSVPFSVGGKLYADGSVSPDTDQFNGRVDSAFLRMR